MKIPIPLNSSLCTDSHKNEIKNPNASKDLFSKNQTYLYNGHLTNAKKTIVPEGDYITTKGDILKVIPGAEKTQIYHNGRVIADVLSLGIEDTSFLDCDDAVVHGGSLWTVRKTLEGYAVEQTDLSTHEKTENEVIMAGVQAARFIRNTHKIIALNVGGNIAIDGAVYNSQNYPDMSEYLSSFDGELTAVEVNGKIYFGYNNPAGVAATAPSNTVNINIAQDANGYRLMDEFTGQGLDQNEKYVFVINVAANVKIGAGASGFAMDLLTGILNPQNHNIVLNLGDGVVISGKGGDGGNASNKNGGIGQNGTTAINVGSNITINGNSTATVQGGGGGGGACHVAVGNGANIGILSGAGGGGAGIPAGIGGVATGAYKQNGQNGTIGLGGVGGQGTNAGFYAKGGKGGNPSINADPGTFTSNTTAVIGSKYAGTAGKGGDAIRLLSPATCIVNGPTIVGAITKI
jgi:hypothetical protein